MGLESPLSYVSAFTTNPVELRARRGRCRLGPPGRFHVLKAHAASPWVMCLMEIIAMSPVKTRTKSETKARPAAIFRQRDQSLPRFVGIDLHKEVATFQVISQSGASLHAGKFPVNPKAIGEFARAHLLPTDSLAVEVTSNTWAFVRLVRPYVAKIVVSNPMKTKAIAEANIKTDKVDALVLAQLLRCDYLPSVWVPTPATENSRALAARRTAMVNQRTAIRNRIHAVLARRLVKAPTNGLFTEKGLAWLKQVELDPLDRALINADVALLDALAQQSLAIDLMIVNDCYADPDVQLLMTIPGIDYTIAHALKATFADVSRFSDPDKAASYLGLVPSVKQSAAKCYNGPITKAGSSQARWLLIQGAQRVGQHPGPLGAFFRKLERRKNRNVAVVATARKMVTIAWHMLINKEPYRYAVPQSTEAKLAGLRVKATGVKRKGGNPKGSKGTPKLGSGGSRIIPSLDQVYARQDLPGRKPLAQGEKRMIRDSGTEEYVASLDEPKRVPRKGRTREE
jgi:transposase